MLLRPLHFAVLLGPPPLSVLLVLLLTAPENTKTGRALSQMGLRAPSLRGGLSQMGKCLGPPGAPLGWCFCLERIFGGFSGVRTLQAPCLCMHPIRRSGPTAIGCLLLLLMQQARRCMRLLVSLQAEGGPGKARERRRRGGCAAAPRGSAETFVWIPQQSPKTTGVPLAAPNAALGTAAAAPEARGGVPC